jgi:RNA polymerase sigma factor (sigma-70 family)
MSYSPRMVPESEECSAPDVPPRHRTFATTHWSVVLATRDTEPDRARAALEHLCAVYWYPIYACIRRFGHEHHEAEDLTQGFWEELLSIQALQRAEPDRGRFRCFLLKALKHYLQTHHRREHRLKRAGGKCHVSLDAMSVSERYQCEPAERWTPEQLFERRWALALLEVVLDRLRAEFAQRGRTDLFAELKECVWHRPADGAYRDLAARFQLSETVVRVTVHRLRRRFRKLLSEEVAHTVSSPTEIVEEIHYLGNLLHG